MSTLPATAQSPSLYQTDILGPAGSHGFGGKVQVLPNGNIVVVDPNYDSATETKVGAVYLYHGETLALISMLTGSNSNDQVGSGGVTALSNGNFVVSSPNWNLFRGAATWVDGETGISGVVSAANSLVGTYGSTGGGDNVGSEIVALSNGNYVVLSPVWGNADRLGAATWANGTTGIAGAVTWGAGTTNTAGVVGSSNSVRGVTPLQGETMTFQAANDDLRVIVGRDLDQVLTIVERSPRLAVSLSGNGFGTVTSVPPGILCGDDCVETYSHGTSVTLTATPAAGSTFDGWTGACTGSSTCTVTMDNARFITATFTQVPVVQPLLFLPLIQRQ